MNKFHYYAISTAFNDTYPDNKGGLFKNNLANSINLDGEWEVGIGSITCKAFDVTHLQQEDETIMMKIFDIEKSDKKLEDGWLTWK